MQRFIIGTRENVEAEYGAYSYFDGTIMILSLYNDEPEAVETFNTKEAAVASLAEIEDRSTIEWLF